jgi:hypothetical protein
MSEEIKKAIEISTEIVKNLNIKSAEPELIKEITIGLLNNEPYEKITERTDEIINKSIQDQQTDEIEMKSLGIEDEFERELYNEFNQSSKLILQAIKDTYKQAKNGNQDLTKY